MNRFECIDCRAHGDWRCSAHTAASDASGHETATIGHKTWLRMKDLEIIQRERGSVWRVAFS